MKGNLCHELEVDLPADEVWGLYGSLELVQLCVDALPNVLQEFDVVQGDGGVGTILHLTFPPGTPGPRHWREEFVKVDGENRMKEAVVVDGGFLELGFSSYTERFEIVEGCGGGGGGGSSSSSCTIKSTIEYEVDEEHAANAAFVTIEALAAIAEAAAKHLIEQKTSCAAN